MPGSVSRARTIGAMALGALIMASAVGAVLARTEADRDQGFGDRDAVKEIYYRDQRIS